MSKNPFQDIIKIKIVKPTSFENSFSDKNEIKERKKVSYNMLWFIALVSVIFLFFAVSFLFSNAKITINPKTKDFALNKNLTATKNPNIDGLSYDLVVLSGEESRELNASEEKDYLEYAKGEVLIYNSFNSSPQPLLIDTRLEGSNGKIYKTKIKAVVPGMAKNGIPGKIGVEIYGAEAGEEYNSIPLDFKILGFKNTSKYSKFYARSVGEIKGGLKGKTRQVSEVEKENAIKELKNTLFAELFQKAKDQTPKDFVLLKDAAFLNMNEKNETSSANEGSITIKIKGTFNGILFNKEKLTKEIINEVLNKNDNTDVYVSNIEDLSFLQSNKELIALNDMKDFTFNLSGTAKVIWKIDSERLVGELLGRNKKDFNQILSEYPNIDSAEFSIKPVWENSFPDKSKDMKIIINYPK